MAAKKASAAAAAAAAADSLKKRKRDKAEEAAGRTKKRKPQVGDDSKETTAATPATATTATMTPTKSAGKSPGKKNGTPKIDVVVAPSAALAPPAAPAATSTWRLSEPMGGCIANIDPVFSADEAHLILCYNTSLQVYSTDDSLLERRINLPVDLSRPQSRVVAVVLSPTTPSLLWVGRADGSLFRADWTTGAVEAVQRYAADDAPLPPLAAMDVAVVRFDAGPREVLYLSEGVPKGGPAAWRVAAYDTATLSQKPGRTLFTAPTTTTTTTTPAAIDLLRTTGGGRFVVGARGPTVFVGALTAAGARLDRLAYQFYALDAPDAVACLDVLVTVPAKRLDGDDDAAGASATAAPSAVLDLVVGCVRGVIYVYGDVANRLRNAAAPADKTEAARKRKAVAVQPRKHHWHRRSVRTVKWSKDGNYFVSGGPETVLVLWQTDTGRLDFLPHLSASIENVVVSPRGASYAVHLDDNSAMVLSTAEMEPTFHVAGLQALTAAAAAAGGPSRDAGVRRTWSSATAADVVLLQRPVPAVVHPADASRLLLRVNSGGAGNSNTHTSSSNSSSSSSSADAQQPALPSASLLQTFDLAAFRSVARQPLARTNPTDANMTLRGFPLTEPAITQLCASRDGRWLASVDEWQPPARDISGLAAGGAAAAANTATTTTATTTTAGAWARSRREIHLKFWAVGDDNTYELVSRIDDAHASAQQAESVFGVAADPRHANRFATLGDDGVLRFWGIKTRVRDGLVARDDRGRPLVSWHCLQAVPLAEAAAEAVGPETANNGSSNSRRAAAAGRSGALAFSEDGSTVFAALGAPDAAVLYAVDAEAGAVRSTLHGLFRGAVRGVAVLGAALVLLSADLRVYDLVADALRYGVRLVAGAGAEAGAAAESDLVAAAALTQLAVDRHAQTFVVAVPYRQGKAVTTAASRLLVFSPDRAQPLFAHDLPTLVVSLLPSVGRAGFVAIDAAAQAWSLADAADTATLGQSLAALHLPTASEEQAAEEGLEVEDGEEEAEEESDDDDVVDDKDMKDIAAGDNNGADHDDDDDDDDDDLQSAVVIPQQKLQDIFEAAPAASASIEDLFWQVSGLLTGLPPQGVKA